MKSRWKVESCAGRDLRNHSVIFDEFIEVWEIGLGRRWLIKRRIFDIDLVGCIRRLLKRQNLWPAVIVPADHDLLVTNQKDAGAGDSSYLGENYWRFAPTTTMIF